MDLHIVLSEYMSKMASLIEGGSTETFDIVNENMAKRADGTLGVVYHPIEPGTPDDARSAFGVVGVLGHDDKVMLVGVAP